MPGRHGVLGEVFEGGVAMPLFMDEHHKVEGLTAEARSEASVVPAALRPMTHT